jgi:hypothetical protein
VEIDKFSISIKNMPKSRIDYSEKNILSEATPVRIGLVIAFLGAFAAATWWSSSITGKLDTILAAQSGIISNMTELSLADHMLERELAEFKLQISVLDTEIKALKKDIK